MNPADDAALPFWSEPEGRGATKEEIDSAERYIGHVLPRAFRDLLGKSNGGVSNYSTYVRGELRLPFLPVFGVSGSSDAGSDTLMRAYDVREAFGIPDGIVVFAASGHFLFGFDYRSGAAEPRVVFRNNEDEEIIRDVASSFDEFLEGLIEE